MPSVSKRLRSPSTQPKYNSKREKRSSSLAKIDLEIKRLQDECSDPVLLKKEIVKFEHLPLSSPTQRGIKSSGYTDLTEIQKISLPYALQGRDILGAAKTGSGKTLAFLIPILETLYKLKWTKLDRLGALIITPTRELAYQLFNVLRRVGRFHSFSAGLLIGGKDVETERNLIHGVNILVATPGRLLGHIDQTPDFVYDNLRILVLDEADRCLDEGFERTLKAIVTSLPKDRHTLLFSATQKKSLSALALLSLKDPKYISILETSEFCTPDQLIQKYAICGEEEKLNVLYSFVKSHLKKKILVFVSSCKQAKFIYEIFRKLQPGMIIACLHGRQKQIKRLEVFDQFSRKSSICLISTDVASRGLDFTLVDWVFQLDCPEDTDAYIHRVGRTARYKSHGNSFLLLSKREANPFIEKLRAQRVPITRTSLNTSKLINITPHIMSLCTQFPEIKYLSQRSIVSYIRGIHLRKDKSVFDVFSIPAVALSNSYGLENVPNIKILKSRNNQKNISRDVEGVVLNKENNGSDDIGDNNINNKTALKDVLGSENNDTNNSFENKSVKSNATTRFKKLAKMCSRKNATVLSKHYMSLIERKEDDARHDDDDFLVLKRNNHEIDIPEPKVNTITAVSHRKILKLKKKAIKSRGIGTHITFDSNGNEVKDIDFRTLESFANEKSLDLRADEFISKASRFIEKEDKIDMEVARASLKEKRALKKKSRHEHLHSQAFSTKLIFNYPVKNSSKYKKVGGV